MKSAHNKTTRIVIADDHSIFRKGLAQIISEAPDLTIVAEAENGNELMAQVEKTKPDVVLMDLNMPEKTGWDLVVPLKSAYPKLALIVLSVSSEEEYAIKFFKAGVAAYLNKAAAPQQVVEAIRKTSRGEKFVTSHIAEKLVAYVGKARELPPHDYLSAREFQTMLLIASGKRITDIAKELSVSVPTISTYRTRALEKMNLKNNAQLTNYVFKNKLLD